MDESARQKFAERRAEVKEGQNHISLIVNDNTLSDSAKAGHLLSFIAEQALETNFMLEEIKDELFEHTLALDSLKSD